MPARDGSGPIGMGPMTGRGAGLCTGYENTTHLRAWSGRGLGRGRAARVFARGVGQGMTDLSLKEQALWMQKRLEFLKARIKEQVSKATSNKERNIL